MRPALRVDSLSKCYRIGTPTGRYRTLREALVSATLAPWRLLRGGNAAAERLWALKDVSFEVKPGEVVGVIGRNGAGKSTLLKILGRITEPTHGRVEIRGRVGSLLEVGTGFHPELTGRENVYLNGAILGMTRREVVRRFDEIVAFSGVERFLDTPVKRYSSGMRMRLAFAVAAHFNPEVLLVDEVLAVGDAAFQRRCVKKMEDVGRQGSTVLFVSHNMNAVTRLCPRAILLGDSRVQEDGPAADIVNHYLRTGVGVAAERVWTEAATAPGDAVVRLRAVRVRSEGTVRAAVDIRRPVHVQMEYDVLEGGRVLVPALHFVNEEGLFAFIVNDLDPEWRGKPRPVGRYVSRACLPGNLLAEGVLVVSAAICAHEPYQVHVHEREAVAFQVVDSLDGDSARGDYAGPMPGVVRPLVPWLTEYAPFATPKRPVPSSSVSEVHPHG
jgi:lipopolysaccharide transport system ATP-binding protein